MSDTRTVTREALAAALRTLGSVYEANRSNANGMADAIFAALPAPGLDNNAFYFRLIELLPTTCDWGGCDNNAMLARFDEKAGWLPVCQWHIEAGASHLAPITACIAKGLWPDPGEDEYARLRDGER